MNIKKLKVFEAFSGMGSQHRALSNIKANFEIIGISEIDKIAIKSYNLLHGDTLNYGDISKVDYSNFPDFDLLTFSFPCQSITNMGNKGGLAKGSGTTSSLIWECERTIREKKPKFLLMENVKNLISPKHIKEYNLWKDLLDNLGYNTYDKVLNSKDFGVAQARERVFAVSIRKDVDNKTFSFNIPKIYKTFQDIQEPNVVADKYYKLSPYTKKRLDEGGNRIIPTGGVCLTILTNQYGGKNKNLVQDSKGVRRMFPRESMKAFGFTDKDYEVLTNNGLKDNHIYKLTGNTIAIPVLEEIFKEILRINDELV